LAGALLLVILGVTGLGTAVKFIPRPVVVGFTNGIAVIIASTQIKDFFGLKSTKSRANSWRAWEFSPAIAARFLPWKQLLGVFALLLILIFSRYVKKVPGYIVALFVGTAVVAFFKLPVETIGTRFGGIPSGFPKLQIPQFRFDLVGPLILPAVTVAMLGAIESLMSAVVSESHER